MNIASLPLVLFILLPGFLSINIAFLVGNFRRLSTFQATLWSLAVGLLLLAVIYPVYVYLVSPPLGEEGWLGLVQILVNPSLVPVQVWILLYVFALFLSILVGVADRKGIIEKLFHRIGIDLSKRGDIWSNQFRAADYVRVYLRDGAPLVGWPEYYSKEPELYLTNVKFWSVEESDWLEVEGIRGVLLHGDEITRIEFLKSPDEDGKEAAL